MPEITFDVCNYYHTTLAGICKKRVSITPILANEEMPSSVTDEAFLHIIFIYLSVSYLSVSYLLISVSICQETICQEPRIPADFRNRMNIMTGTM